MKSAHDFVVAFGGGGLSYQRRIMYIMYSLMFWCGGLCGFCGVVVVLVYWCFFMLFDDFCFCVTNRFVFVLVDKKFFACFCVLCRCTEFISVFLFVVLMLVKFACGAIDCELLCGGCICSV